MEGLLNIVLIHINRIGNEIDGLDNQAATFRYNQLLEAFARLEQSIKESENK